MTKKKLPKFLRRNWSKASRLGKGRKKKQIWRSPKGRHSKTRNERKGYPAIVKIGYKQEQKESGLIEKKTPVMVNNVKQLEGMKKEQIAIIGNVGNKKRIEIAKKAKEKGIAVSNLDVNKFLKKTEKKQKMKADEKAKSTSKKGSERVQASSDSANQAKEKKEEKKSEDKKEEKK